MAAKNLFNGSFMMKHMSFYTQNVQKIGYDPAQIQWNDLPEKLVKLLLKYDQMKDAFIIAVKRCGSFDHGNILAKQFPNIKSLTPKQLNDLISAWQSNREAINSFGFDGSHQQHYGIGIIPFITKWDSHRFPDKSAVATYCRELQRVAKL